MAIDSNEKLADGVYACVVMAFVTYVLLAGVALGTQSRCIAFACFCCFPHGLEFLVRYFFCFEYILGLSSQAIIKSTH